MRKLEKIRQDKYVQILNVESSVKTKGGTADYIDLLDWSVPALEEADRG